MGMGQQWDIRRGMKTWHDTGGVKTTVSVWNGLMTFLSYLEMYEVGMTYACN